MPDRRQILEQVAAGTLSPEEADRLLREGEPEATGPEAASEHPVRRVKVSVGVGGIDVIGDPTVAAAEVEGPHRAEVEGDALVVHGEWEPGEDGFTFRVGRHAQRRRARAYAVHIGDRLAAGQRPPRLEIRMNPSLALDCELDAGPLTISGLDGPIRARVAAGPVTIDGFSDSLDVHVNAGAVRATGKLVRGESRIEADAGGVRVELDPSSSVHVVAKAALGKVVVPGSDGRTGKRFAGDRREATIGAGDAELRVETAMGTVHVSVA